MVYLKTLQCECLSCIVFLNSSLYLNLECHLLYEVLSFVCGRPSVVQIKDAGKRQ